MSTTSDFFIRIGVATLLGATPMAAQGGAVDAPWAVTVTPTMNPLPIGFCGAVRLTMLDRATKDRPRTPQGMLVSIGDFDMSVTGASPSDVAGDQTGPTNWSACACQGATVGSAATITATYPAKSLAAKSRAPGVEFQVTAPLTIGKVAGSADPAACQALRSQTLATRGAPVAPVAPVATPIAGGVRAAPPVVRAAPNAAVKAALERRAAAAGAGKGPPTTVTATGIVEGVRVAFSPGDAGNTLVSIDLFRKDGAALSAKRGTGTFDNLNCLPGCQLLYFEDSITDPALTYQYTVVNSYADGTTAASPAVSWKVPPLVNPSGFTAKSLGEGKVSFGWRPVAGAVRYRLDGPGVVGTELVVADTVAVLSNVPRGPATWKLTSLFPMNFADYTKSSTASLIVRTIPPHGIPWLSKRNGAGSALIADRHYKQPCQYTQNGVRPLCEAEMDRLTDLVPLRDQAGQWYYQGVYGNAEDLGFGRRTSCAQLLKLPPELMTTLCMTASHGPGPGETGFANTATMERYAGSYRNPPDPFSSIGDNGGVSFDAGITLRTFTMIIKDASGMQFLVFGPPGGGNGYGGSGGVSEYILLDTEGKKYAPHVCMSCHGGTYDSVSRRVKGGSLLPLNPSGLVYARGPSGRAAQEEPIRKINQIVASSEPSPAIVSYINGLYGGKVNVPGAKAVDDYVPSGWTAQASLYRIVVRPYCSTCHLAAQPSYSFSSWGNFQSNAALIRAAVCVTHSMPHAEVPFKAFWTKDTGMIYLPGYLAASLGYNSC